MTQMAGVAMETDIEQECGLYPQKQGSVQDLLAANGG